MVMSGNCMCVGFESFLHVFVTVHALEMGVLTLFHRLGN